MRMPASPPRGAFHDDAFTRNKPLPDINMRDFPVKDDFSIRAGNRDDFSMRGGTRDDFSMRSGRRDDFQMKDEYPERNRFEDRNLPMNNNFPPRMNNAFDDHISRNRFDRDPRETPSRNDFDGRNIQGNMFTVSNPRNIDERSFRMSSPPRMVPPPEFNFDDRNSQDNGRLSVFNRLQTSNRIQLNDASEGYWEQGGGEYFNFS